MSEQSADYKTDRWPEVLECLLTSLSKAQFNAHFLGSQGVLQADGTLSVSLPASANIAQITNRLSHIVKRAVLPVYGDVGGINYRLALPQIAPVPFEDEPEPEHPDAEFTGAYYDKRNAIIQPGVPEIATQYFRRKWRPLLGPTLSELVRELRQRCNYLDRRDHFRATYKSLAMALGVSEKTIKRALSRDGQGNFKNRYLNHFISDMKTLKESNGQGQIRTLETRFVIYLDEPLTPEDEAKLTEGTK